MNSEPDARTATTIATTATRTRATSRNAAPRLVALLAVVAMCGAACSTNATSAGTAATADPVAAVDPNELVDSGEYGDNSSDSADEAPPATDVVSAEPGVIRDPVGAPIEAPPLPAGFAIDGDAAQTVAADGTVTTTGDIVVTTTSGSLQLPDASVIERPDGTVSTVASVPLPTTGPLANARPSALPKGRIGTATGAELAGTVPHLNPQTVYTYVLFRGDLSLDTGVDSGPSAMPALDHFSVFGQEPGLVVIDPDDYFYIGGTCPGGGTSDKENGKKAGGNSGASNAKAADFDPVVLSLVPAEVAVPCGLGISNFGLIPAVPDLSSAEIPAAEMGAHIVVHGSEVVAPGLAVDGTFYFQLLEPGFRLIANGTLLASLSVISNALGVDIPLGDATLDMGVSSNGLHVRFVAETPTLDDLLLPVVIDFLGADGKVRTEGAFDFAVSADGIPSIGPDSYVQIAGELDLQTGGLAGIAGADLSAVHVDGLMRLDRTGYRITGAMEGSLIPAIDINAGATLDAFISFGDLADSSIEVVGAAGIGAIDLGANAGIRIDRNGVEAWGTADLPLGAIEVRGKVAADEVYLTGAASAVVPLGPIADAASAARAELEKAKADVATIDDEIARLRADIAAGRDANQAGLRQAQADVAAERSKLDAILDTIAYNDRLITQKRNAQAATGDPFVDFGLELEIQALQLANTVQYGYRRAAQGALDIAIGALQLIEGGLEIIPVDADPRIVALFIAREAAMLVLNAATDLLGLVPDEVRASIEFTIGSAGVVGDASIETCTDGTCSVVVAGTVSTTPPQLCFVLLDVEICVGLGELDIR